ncbi:phosphatase [Photobacterium kishitanii]|uniref:Phosphatase n=1 Tax=Photobacterium kishitanii TaxID=318456 RepID=A0A2T3KLT9_9GAMM|nr:phosphatase [Photobacterium kishitanii]PSV00620.1 phosphatase [Photobacterium kishitanii]
MDIKLKNIITAAKDGEFDVLIHCQNIYHSWGKGFVVPLSIAFPDAKKADLATKKGDSSKLGTYSKAEIITTSKKEIMILNCYCQKSYGQGNHFILESFKKVLKSLNTEFKGKRIAYPLIGAGRAGGSWSEISKIIDETLTDVKHCLYILDASQQSHQ